MSKKKAASAGTGGKAALKATKKAKAAAKGEKKGTKKAKLATGTISKGKGKSAAKEEDDQDLEGILEKVRAKMSAGSHRRLTYRVDLCGYFILQDATRLGIGPYCHRRIL
jgi:hypothetical protein